MIKHKRMITGISCLGIALLVALLVVIFGNKDKYTADAKNDANSSASMLDVSVSSINNGSTKEKSDAPDQILNADSEDHVSTNISEFDKKTETPAPPVVSNESTLTDPKQKPTYNSSQTKVNEDSGQPRQGDKKDGKVYIVGFGWVKDEGGGASGSAVGQSADSLTGDKVGNMG
jgi:hypothetical protein